MKTEVKVYINGIDVSQYLIQGSISEDSAYSSNIITCTGQIVLGGTTEVLDFNRTKYKIGSAVDIWCKLDNGEIAKHPKGRQYIINSSTNFENTISMINSRPFARSRSMSVLEVACASARPAKEAKVPSSLERLNPELLPSC